MLMSRFPVPCTPVDIRWKKAQKGDFSPNTTRIRGENEPK
jgi:hypothetical protein